MFIVGFGFGERGSDKQAGKDGRRSVLCKRVCISDRMVAGIRPLDNFPGCP